MWIDINILKTSRRTLDRQVARQNYRIEEIWQATADLD